MRLARALQKLEEMLTERMEAHVVA